MDYLHIYPYQPYTRITPFYAWLVLFIILAGLSLTVGFHIKPYTRPPSLFFPSPYGSNPPWIREFNRFLWLPYNGSGWFPWDTGLSPIGPSFLRFCLSVFWWAFLSFAIVKTSHYFIRIIKRRRP